MPRYAPSYADAVSDVSAADRVTYLKRVMLWTLGGLSFTALVGLATTALLYGALAAGVTAVFSPMVSGIAILACFGIAHWLAPSLVFGGQKVLGFFVATFFEGISFGWLLLSAIAMGMQEGNPFGLVSMALLLTAATGAGMTAYVWSGPREFRLLGAALSAITPALLLLMVASFVLPMVAPGLLGGPLGLGLTALFVLISAAGLLWQINSVLHHLHTDQHIEGAYLITMGVLVLYWNILTLLMRLNRD